MIAGLVQNQIVRVRQHGGEQGDAHRLAAAETARRRGGIEMAQAIAFQFMPQALADIPTLANGVEVFRRTAARLDAQQRLQRVLHAGQAGHRGIRWRGYLLGKVMHAAGAQATSAGRLQPSGKQARQDGLANAIASNQAGGALVEGFAELGEKRPAIRQGVGHAF